MSCNFAAWNAKIGFIKVFDCARAHKREGKKERKKERRDEEKEERVREKRANEQRGE